ncbi:AraC-like DNA-binding protein [Pedobacter cryoconitis]|uniref:AraC-like DNA-binding protein n=1 Tax=Pedobacter cryoconitis TaxID=188932 RepID=A0A7W8ZLK5_9SPHI|nr:AraC family transcriptional regulator [Pedobacter cryoconitis]MBB5636137.1 AraC-like DNA-binding protein [Pedobacter cryoconitis]MBB6272944.1 AraC-like DNA-binding protein [Pedobacter cryoconitis]
MMQHKLNPVSLSKTANLQTLVENRTAYTLERCELNVFETYSESYKVPLIFNDFVITSMLRGKKVMHLFNKAGFEYLPGETVIIPPSQAMQIDFPEASGENPAQCIALAIDHDQIKQTILYLNEYFPKVTDGQQWALNYDEYHFYNNEEISFLINKMIRICGEGSKEKDILADLTLKELLVRIMQTQNLKIIDQQNTDTNQNPLAYVIGYIKANLSEKINISSLSSKACMSKATFYRLFKRELGISPNDFILSEKISRAKQMLARPGSKIAAISYDLGFSDANYFIRVFKKLEGITPGSYQGQLSGIKNYR